MRGTILIIDDEETLGHFLKESLTEEGYGVLLAQTGQEGLKALGENEVDLVLLDLKLPDQDGLEILRGIRGRDEALPVIILTGHAEEGSEREAKELGAYRYLEKPPDLALLKSTIAEALDLREAIRSWKERGEGPQIEEPPEPKEEVSELPEGEKVRRLRKEMERLATLEVLSRALAEAMEPLQMVEAGLEAAISLRGVAGAAIFVLTGEEYILAGQRNLPWEAFQTWEGRRIPARGEVVDLLIPGGGPVVLGGEVRDPWFEGLAAHLPSGHPSALVPLHSRDKNHGLMLVVNRLGRPFAADQMALLSSLGERIGGGLARALREERGKREAESRLPGAILQSMSLGLLVADLHGRVTLANRAAEGLLGYGPGELIGQDMEGALGVKGLATKEGLKRGVFTPYWEGEVTTRGGGEVKVGLSLTPLPGEGGETSGVVVVMSDLSEAKRMEEERRRLDRLALLGEMSAVVAHEIRNPLAGIGAGIQHIASKVKEGDAIYESIEMVMRESERVNRIIEDILMVSRPVRLKVGPCDVVEVVEEVLGGLEGKAEAREVEISRYFWPGVPTIRGDPSRLSQAFSQLLSYRLESLDKGDRLMVTVMGGEGEIEVEARDNGGPLEGVEEIFEPFQGPKSGLGLAIAQRVIEAHGGEIEVESDEVGVAFLVRLPVEG